MSSFFQCTLNKKQKHFNGRAFSRIFSGRANWKTDFSEGRKNEKVYTYEDLWAPSPTMFV
jgi:hypothetical protein